MDLSGDGAMAMHTYRVPHKITIHSAIVGCKFVITLNTNTF